MTAHPSIDPSTLRRLRRLQIESELRRLDLSRRSLRRARLAFEEEHAGADAFAASPAELLSVLVAAARTGRMAYDTMRVRAPRYGNWCGPGNTNAPPIDGLDRCCQAHDNAYGVVGVGGPCTHPGGCGGASGINMWTPQGFLRTVPADLALVRCSRAQGIPGGVRDPVRAIIERTFLSRLEVARALRAPSMPPCVRNNRTAAIWDLPGVLRSCGLPWM
jgi:hypothetical protein